MSKLRVAFIGAGRISDLHAIEYLRNPAAQIVAVCDVDRATAERQAQCWNIASANVYADYRGVLEREMLIW